MGSDRRVNQTLSKGAFLRCTDCGVRDADFVVSGGRFLIVASVKRSLVGVAPPEAALCGRRNLIDRRNAGLPCTVILDQPANMLEYKAESAKKPD